MTVTHSGQRRTPKAAKTSSVFKKVVMAVSGIILVLYLVAHMVGNLKLFAGAETFNGYSEWIRRIGEPAVPGQTVLWIIRIVLLAAVVAHIWAAISLWRQAKRARPQQYVARKQVAQSYASRTMRWGGVILGLFVVYHLLDLTFGVANPAGHDATPYDRAIAGFSNPLVVAVYVVALLALGFHLRHGVWSATQTLGQSNKTRERTVNAFATVFAVVLTAGFLIPPLSVLVGIIE